VTKKRMCLMIFWGICLVFLAACKRDTALEIQKIADIPLPPDAKEIDFESTDLRLHRALSYEMLYALGALWNVSAERTDEDFFELPLGLSIKDDVRKYYGDILPDMGWQKQDTKFHSVFNSDRSLETLES
jgi:hypothetical protein